MKNKVIVSIIVFILLIMLGCYSHIFINLWCIVTENGYFIPQESNILVFNATKMNSGSGGWWLYGEDNKYYYALNPFGGYLKLQKGNEPSDFDKFNYETWHIKIPFTDTRDGKIYKTTKIGEQVWMAENLNFAAEGSKCYGEGGKVRNEKTGDWDIILSNAEIQANCDKYGRLYDWETAITACPNGWHLPSKEEWKALMATVGEKTAGKYLKAASGWNDRENGESGNGTDNFGFSALPGGIGRRAYNGFGFVGEGGSWWSASDNYGEHAYGINIRYEYDDVVSRYNMKDFLDSVRCLHD